MKLKNLCLVAFAMTASLFSTGCQDPIQAMLGRQAEMTENVIKGNQEFAQGLLDKSAAREDRLFDLLEKEQADDEDDEECTEEDGSCEDDETPGEEPSCEDEDCEQEAAVRVPLNYDVAQAALGESAEGEEVGMSLEDDPGTAD